MLGEYQQAIDTNVETPPTLSALALDLMGRDREAIELLRSLERTAPNSPVDLWTIATRALLEGNQAEGMKWTEKLTPTWTLRDPCAGYYLGRHLARMGEVEAALARLRTVVEGGFYCASFLTRDPWLDALRSHAEFRAILQLADTRQRAALAAFVSAQGDRVLGTTSPAM
jgi:hypothetical protein